MTTQIQPDRIPPTTTAYVIATAILAGVTGYFVGQGTSLGLFTSSSSASTKKTNVAPRQRTEKRNDEDDGDASNEYEEDEEVEEEYDSEEEDDGGELANFSDSAEEVKLVLAVRTDLGMTKGKMAAQCSHATLACYKYFLSHSPDSPILRRWERGGQAKIALQVKSEEELVLFQAQAMSLGLCARVVQDAGRTQIASGSRTVLGILGPKSVVDGVTGHLKLL